MELKIKTLSDIPFNVQCLIVEAYCKKYQSFQKVPNGFSGFDDHVYQLTEHKKYPDTVTLDNHWPEYWVRCHKTKTSYVFDIWRK